MSTAPTITAEQARWEIIYPVYINANKKRSEGRRVGVKRACENPTVQEIAQVCTSLQLQSIIEVPSTFYSNDNYYLF